MNNKDDMIGKKFERLEVIKFSHSDKHKKRNWICKCNCGNLTTATTSELRRGSKKSCGCLTIEKNKSRKIRTEYRSSLRNVWYKMKKRCFDVNDTHYKYYGARNISVSEEWMIFQNFYNDMINEYIKHRETNSKYGTLLERIDNNKNYTKNNCTWTNIKGQNNNRRNNLWFKCINENGYSKVHRSKTEAGKDLNINRKQIAWCLSKQREHFKEWKFKYVDTDDNLNNILSHLKNSGYEFTVSENDFIDLQQNCHNNFID